MQYSSTSINEVIARIIRNTRVSEMSYIQDITEWIPEAMGMMRTKVETSPRWVDIEIDFHLGMLPCGIIDLKAVEWRGMRLPYGNTVRTYNAPQYKSKEPVKVGTTDGYITVPLKVESPNGNYIYDDTAIPLYCTNFKDVLNLPLCNSAWYSTEMGYIHTSFPDGCIRLHHTVLPTDEQGLPLIPDNEFYKEALYWYSRGKMSGAGWKDPLYSPDYCDAKFEVAAARAMSQIRYPSTDQMEFKVAAMTRFIPPPNYFQNFFSTPQGEGTIPSNYDGVI